ncbi:hypothetical protein Pcinc_009735 [Petrolisthes cinctipes]|uniref:Uncharacterized protein n=1 Tax=Petrolisthes cinctipes TaxID=88211 RepID=A0AAE1G445_PETCI|nr:hypothetical protein Pcinc_009735 [Petrolisthes cinctipes]
MMTRCLCCQLPAWQVDKLSCWQRGVRKEEIGVSVNGFTKFIKREREEETTSSSKEEETTSSSKEEETTSSKEEETTSPSLEKRGERKERRPPPP